MQILVQILQITEIQVKQEMNLPLNKELIIKAHQFKIEKALQTIILEQNLL
jgi:hypothetical protein